MKRLIGVFLLILLLCGCADAQPAGSVTSPPAPETTLPAETVPADGNPDDVTCKGSYTGEFTENAVVVRSGNRLMTREALQVWYWAAAADHKASGNSVQPDYDLPLDTQSCPLDSSVNSWQQYFLKQALTDWHTANMLLHQSDSLPMPTEEAYQPNWKEHAKRMDSMPAAKFLYGHNVYYQVNTLHQTYLDALPQLLDTLAREKGYTDTRMLAQQAFGAEEEHLLTYARVYNRAYMYFTAMSYYIEPTQETLDAYHTQSGITGADATVNIRHALLVPQDILQAPPKKRSSKNTEPTEPIVLEKVQIAGDGTVTCSEEAWAIPEKEAQDLLERFRKGYATEADFAIFANARSKDAGSANNGGAYPNLKRGQLMKELDDWCFDSSRKSGDITMFRSQYGIHLLYFSDWVDTNRTLSREDYIRQQQLKLLENARECFPMTVDYSAILLRPGNPCLAPEELLYPDIGHERFPEIPVYLQQDYPNTMYGNYPIRSHGCGITTMAMLASYMADDELTPPEMCARFGSYCYRSGTDGRLFSDTPASMGFYCRKKTYDVKEVWAALEEGQVVVNCQHAGYWTRGGHYIALERIAGERMVQVRDSNIFNYSKLKSHQQDMHKWSDIVRNGTGYWIYEDKVVTIPACSRCGDPESLIPRLLLEEYTCEKCSAALLRRNTYLS